MRGFVMATILPQPAPLSKKAIWSGRIMSGLPVLLLVFSATLKFLRPASMLETFAHLGIPERLSFPLGVLELTCTIIYLIPRTSVLGAILLTGYLGGAVLTHLRVGEPVFMPLIAGVLVWGGLFLLESRVRALIPLRRAAFPLPQQPPKMEATL